MTKAEIFDQILKLSTEQREELLLDLASQLDMEIDTCDGVDGHQYVIYTGIKIDYDI